MILRHADAGCWEPGGDDFSRPLSPEGTEHSKRIASWFTTHLKPPEQILCSAARRTRKTIAPLLSMQASLESLTQYDPQIYNARLETLVALLDFTFAEYNRVLIVGHNPGVSNLASKVANNTNGSVVSGLSTGTLVVVDFPGGWGLGSGRGSLNCQVTRRDLSVD